MTRNIMIWVVILLVLATALQNFSRPMLNTDMAYSEFIENVKEGRVQAVTLEGSSISGTTAEGVRFSTYSPETDNNALIGTLLENKVEIRAREPERNSILVHLLISWSPLILLVLVMYYFLRQMQGGLGGGRGGALSFGKSRARMLSEDQIKTTFADVAGAEEAKNEVQELVDFLRDPERFQEVGGKIPTGVLMVGAPGTGKTLLARAIAGEAKVPFFTISGSDFVEMFVGVGAARVRDMFEQAKKSAPCIIFIDEIDAVGRHRGAGLGGGHDEREQTLNQLLVEMDGFEGRENVIVIAATNRPDVLDPALLRPGRFDRQVVVPLPDIRGREQILRVHMKKVRMDGDMDMMVIARGTPGFSGADLANLVNEAALAAARKRKPSVGMAELEYAKDRIMMGTERRSMIMTDEEKELTAYHEAGHAIVGLHLPAHDPIYKVTIIPRGRALGVTMFLPETDRFMHSKEYLQSKICTLFGGRVAEEIIYCNDKVTTGASNDIKQATELARNMVTRWGLCDKLGPLAYSDDEDEVFLGHSVTRHKAISDETTHAIDQAVREIIDNAHDKAREILTANIDKLRLMGQTLIQHETIDKSQIDDIMAGRPVLRSSGDDKPDDGGAGTDGKKSASVGKTSPPHGSAAGGTEPSAGTA